MIKIGNYYFEVKVIRKNNKNMYLRIKGNILEITCPKYIDEEAISSFIDSRKDWIIAHYIKQNEKRNESKLLFNDYVYIYGQKIPLIILPGRPSVSFKKDRVVIYCKDGNIDRAIKFFYKETKKYLLASIETFLPHYEAILEDYGYDLIPQFDVKVLNSMWGVNYTKKNLIVINAKMIHFDRKYLEAIIWHEMLHFIIPNHSKRYYQVLLYHMPDYKERIKELY